MSSIKISGGFDKLYIENGSPQPVLEPAAQWVNNRLTEGKGAGETNKSNLSAYIGTVRFDLCSKSKHLA